MPGLQTAAIASLRVSYSSDTGGEPGQEHPGTGAGSSGMGKHVPYRRFGKIGQYCAIFYMAPTDARKGSYGPSTATSYGDCTGPIIYRTSTCLLQGSSYSKRTGHGMVEKTYR